MCNRNKTNYSRLNQLGRQSRSDNGSRCKRWDNSRPNSSNRWCRTSECKVLETKMFVVKWNETLFSVQNHGWVRPLIVLRNASEERTYKLRLQPPKRTRHDRNDILSEWWEQNTNIISKIQSINDLVPCLKTDILMLKLEFQENQKP